MLRLVEFIEIEIKTFKVKFKKELEKNEYFNAFIGEWMTRLTKKYYRLI